MAKPVKASVVDDEIICPIETSPSYSSGRGSPHYAKSAVTSHVVGILATTGNPGVWEGDSQA